MTMPQFNRTLLASALSVALLHTTAHAEEDHEHQQHGAHQHGVAQLNLAAVGAEVEIELETPAANIVGFEHQSSSEADHHAVEEAVALLKRGEALFRFNPTAQCSLEIAKIASPLMETSHTMEHDHHEEGEEHHEEHHDEHTAHEEHEEHEAHEETHSEFHAHYHFECKQPAQLSQLQVNLFDTFPATLHLNVQYLLNEKQGAVELEADHRTLHF